MRGLLIAALQNVVDSEQAHPFVILPMLNVDGTVHGWYVLNLFHLTYYSAYCLFKIDALNSYRGHAQCKHTLLFAHLCLMNPFFHSDK